MRTVQIVPPPFQSLHLPHHRSQTAKEITRKGETDKGPERRPQGQHQMHCVQDCVPYSRTLPHAQNPPPPDSQEAAGEVSQLLSRVPWPQQAEGTLQNPLRHGEGQAVQVWTLWKIVQQKIPAKQACQALPHEREFTRVWHLWKADVHQVGAAGACSNPHRWAALPVWGVWQDVQT